MPFIPPPPGAVLWAPTLAQVADYIPTRTLDATAPGSAVYLGTFTPDTTPTEVQAGRLIDQAVATVSAAAGTVDASLYLLATTVAALRAAASIERAYPVRDADINTADQLDKRADAELARLLAANGAAGATEPGVVMPLWSFPDPPAWADINL